MKCTSIEIALVRGSPVRAVGRTNCRVSVGGDACDRAAEHAFDLGHRLAPACALHLAAGIERGGLALVDGGAR